MRAFYTFDCETDPFEYGFFPEPFIWGVYNPEHGFMSWESEDQFVKWLEKQEAIFYAHNGGRFDILFLAKHLSPGRISLINDRVVKAKIGKAELRDSWPLIPMKQAAFGKDDFDYAKLRRDVREKHKGDIRRYLQSDCVKLYGMLERFFEKHPSRPLTLASAGMRALKKIENIEFEPISEAWDADFRNFYFGGRVEARIPGEFRNLRPRLIHVDINSAYPFAMQHAHGFTDCWTVKKLLPSQPRLLQTSMVKLRAKSRGALPLRHVLPHVGETLDFPDEGIHEFFATGWEVLAGLETGTLDILKILEVRVPKRIRDFHRFVDFFAGEKRAAEMANDPVGRLIAKLLLNSCYGKFAQNPRHFLDWKILRKGACPKLSECVFPPLELEGDRVAVAEPAKFPLYYNVATAASITGFVRAYLWRAICSSDEVYYCDTDSLICRKVGRNINIGTELGEWKVEERGIHRIAVAGKKLYSYWNEKNAGHVASKGAMLSASEIARLCHGETIEWRNAAPSMSFRKGRRFTKRRIRATRRAST